jgi:hypothetical protein
MTEAISSVRTTPFELEVRKDTRFDFSNTPVIHTSNNTYISHLYNAVSLAAPITEGILMRIARRVEDDVTDPGLKQDLRAFIGQEGGHTREHRRLNKRLSELGFGLEEVCSELDDMVKEREKKASLKKLMAAVVVGEHAVYSMSKIALSKPKVLGEQENEVRRLFEWHALEEMEHQSVCHDIYVHLYGDNLQRRYLYASVFLQSSSIVYMIYVKLMRELIRRSAKPSAKELADFIKWSTLSPGAAPLLSRELMAFLLPNFKHWGHADMDNSLIQRSLSRVYA